MDSQESDGRFGGRAVSPSDFQDAAVLVLRYPWCGEEFLVFTRRTEEVLHHKGQICFPGGACNPEDGGLWETALREAREEIGIDPHEVELVKKLEPHLTPTGFRVTPFLATISGPFEWKLNLHETAEIFAVPISHLKNPANVRFEKQTWEGKEFLNPHFTYEKHVIWGMTGRILCDVLEIKS